MMTYIFIICKESVWCGGLAFFFFLCYWNYVKMLDCLEDLKRFLIESNIIFAFPFPSKIFYEIINKLSSVLLRKVSSKEDNDLSIGEK